RVLGCLTGLACHQQRGSGSNTSDKSEHHSWFILVCCFAKFHAGLRGNKRRFNPVAFTPPAWWFFALLRRKVFSLLRKYIPERHVFGRSFERIGSRWRRWCRFARLCLTPTCMWARRQ